MTPLTPDDLAELKRVALHVQEVCNMSDDESWEFHEDSEKDIYVTTEGRVEFAVQVFGPEPLRTARAKHIATFDPPMVKRLLVRIRELESSNYELVGMLRGGPAKNMELLNAIRNERDEARRRQVKAENFLALANRSTKRRGDERDQLRAQVKELENSEHYRCTSYPSCNCNSFETCVREDQS